MGAIRLGPWSVPRRRWQRLRGARRGARPLVRGLAVAVFVDTSALYALLDADDPNHAAAVAFFPRLGERGGFVHNYVAVEVTVLVRRRLGGRAVRILHEVALPTLRTIWVDETTHASAVAHLLASPRSRISLVDRVSFQVMRAVGADEAFAFDRHFAREGFRLVP